MPPKLTKTKSKASDKAEVYRIKLLIISFVDDNFGDNLIRICFKNLLGTVLENLGVAEDGYLIDTMPLKAIDEDLIRKSDYIFFAGGGLFGLSYLGFCDYVDRITELAEESNIPVIFSSLGINNMNATSKNENILKDILKRKCIKSISARENIQAFKRYTDRFEIELVCDPGVWTKYVYNLNTTDTTDIIGINVVRGGLFKSNYKSWKLKDELEYLYKLRSLLHGSNLKCKFYTNGSSLDNNALRYFVQEYDITDDEVIYPHTTKDLVETIAGFKAVAAIRMHSSIIAYSFRIPSIALAWNDKIPFFYQSISCPDKALGFSNWDSTIVFKELKSMLLAKRAVEPDLVYECYLMSLYQYLYRVVSEYVLEKTAKDNDRYDFNEVVCHLSKAVNYPDENEFDLRYKIERTEKRYLARFTELIIKKEEIVELKETIRAQKEHVFQSKEEAVHLKKIIKTQGIQTAQLRKEITRSEVAAKTQGAQIVRLEEELTRINGLVIIRILNYAKRKIRHLLHH